MSEENTPLPTEEENAPAPPAPEPPVEQPAMPNPLSVPKCESQDEVEDESDDEEEEEEGLIAFVLGAMGTLAYMLFKGKAK